MRNVSRLLLAALLGIAPAMAHAQINPCPLGTLIPCIGGGAAGATVLIYAVIFPAIRIVFIGILVLMLFYYALRMVLESEEESTITDTKNAYGNAIVGAAIVSLSTLIVDSFGQSPLTNTALVNPAPITAGISNIIFYIRLMVGTSASGLIIFQGVRIILLQGQESEMEQQRKRFFHGLLGIAVILLANAMVNAVMPGANSAIIAQETRGIINFLLELTGFLAVLSFIVAGAFLVLSTEDSGKERAKKAIYGTVIAIIIILSSFVITNYFMSL